MAPGAVAAVAAAWVAAELARQVRRIERSTSGNLPYDADRRRSRSPDYCHGLRPCRARPSAHGPRRPKAWLRFVTMASADAARGAIEAFRGADIRGRRLSVNLAHPKGERPAGDGAQRGGVRGWRGQRGFAGGGFAGGGGGGGYGGGPPAPPPPGRKTFDEKRRRGGHDGEGPPGAGRGAGGKRAGNKNSWDRGRGRRRLGRVVGSPLDERLRFP